MKQLSQLLFGLCASLFVQAQTVTNTKLPLVLENFYQDNNFLWRPKELIDGNVNTAFLPSWSLLYPNHEVVVDLLDYNATVKKVRMFDGGGTGNLNTRLYLVRKDNNQEVFIGTFTGNDYNVWQEYIPPANFVASRMIIRGGEGPQYGNELEIIGDYSLYQAPVYNRPRKPLKNMFGVNTFWWDLMKNDVQYSTNSMYAPKYNRLKEMGISSARFYVDQRQLQADSSIWSFNPTISDFYTDVLVENCAADGIEPLLTIQGNPPHIYNTYPGNHPGQSASPVTYQDMMNRHNVSVYANSAKLGFITAARYGRNSNIPDNLLQTPRPAPVWYVPANVIRKGLNTVKYIEIGNELELGWPDTLSYMTGAMLAPFLSAVYDGHLGSMGPGYGIKTADPSMQVVVPGFGRAATDGYRAIVDWSRQNRGYNQDGSINLPFDVINYHKYSSDGGLDQYGINHIGMPPELSGVLDIADEFVNFSNKYTSGKEVWLSEWGYDYNQQSVLRAPAIGNHPATEVIGAWAIRSILSYASKGIDRMHWFKLYDNYESNGSVTSTQFNSMSLLADELRESGGSNTTPVYKRRTVGDYFAQMKEFQDYTYSNTISNAGLKIMEFIKGGSHLFAIWHVENTAGSGSSTSYSEVTGSYPFPLPGDPTIVVKKLVPGNTLMDSTVVQVVNGSYQVSYSMTPVFIKTDQSIHLVLPVEFTSFTGDCYVDSVQLRWATAREENLKAFEVQGSNDGKTWSTQFSTLRRAATVIPMTYYRIRAVDVDGKITLSRVIHPGCQAVEISLYPNPAKDQIELSVNSKNAGMGRIIIRNAKGAVVYQQQLSLMAGLNQLNLNISMFASGAYLLSVEGSAISKSLKFIKN